MRAKVKKKPNQVSMCRTEYVSEVLQYVSKILDLGDELHKTEVLDVLFDIAEEAKRSKAKSANLSVVKLGFGFDEDF